MLNLVVCSSWASFLIKCPKFVAQGLPRQIEYFFCLLTHQAGQDPAVSMEELHKQITAGATVRSEKVLHMSFRDVQALAGVRCCAFVGKRQVRCIRQLSSGLGIPFQMWSTEVPGTANRRSPKQRGKRCSKESTIGRVPVGGPKFYRYDKTSTSKVRGNRENLLPSIGHKACA